MYKLSVATLGLAVFTATGLADQNKQIVGYLGKTNTRVTIYAGPNSHSARLSKTKDQQYVVIEPYSASWDKIMLRQYNFGYVKDSQITHLRYVLTRKNVVNRGSQTSFPFESGDLASRSGIADYAINYIGKVPYKWGGTDVESGIDCSGFVQKMYGKIGVHLPRTAAEQALVGIPIYRLEDLRKGDRLYFYEAKRGIIGHTGIYEGNGMFIHSSHGKGGVATSQLTESWRRILVAARR